MRRHRPVIIKIIVTIIIAVVFVLTVRYFSRCQELGTMAQKPEFGGAIPKFTKYHLEFGLRRILLGLGSDQLCLFAITPQGDVLGMPENFQVLVRREHLSVASPEGALALAKSYVAVSSPLKVIIISTLDMIPDIDRNPAPQALDNVISAPTAELANGTYIVHLYDWEELGGRVKKWTILVAKDGSVHARSEELANRVGTASDYL